MTRRLVVYSVDRSHRQFGPADRALVVLVDGNDVLRVDFRWRGGQHANHRERYTPNDEPEDDRDEDVEPEGAGQEVYSLSMMVPLAIPPPSHIVCNP